MEFEREIEIKLSISVWETIRIRDSNFVPCDEGGFSKLLSDIWPSTRMLRTFLSAGLQQQKTNETINFWYYLKRTICQFSESNGIIEWGLCSELKWGLI